MIKINLLDWREENKKKHKKLLQMEIIGTVVFTLICIIFLHLLRSGEGNFYSKQNTVLQAETQKLLTENAQLLPFQDRQKTLEKHINAAYSFQFHRFIGIKMLNAITPIIPKDIYLTKLKFDRHLTELQGNATSNIAISSLVTKMDKTGLFKPAKIAEVSEEKYNNLMVTKFLITANIKTDYAHPLPEKTS